ncbi:hypothetical protein DSUL_140051 [Desulfovibrionales bacterium]
MLHLVQLLAFQKKICYNSTPFTALPPITTFLLQAAQPKSKLAASDALVVVPRATLTALQ